MLTMLSFANIWWTNQAALQVSHSWLCVEPGKNTQYRLTRQLAQLDWQEQGKTQQTNSDDPSEFTMQLIIYSACVNLKSKKPSENLLRKHAARMFREILLRSLSRAYSHRIRPQLHSFSPTLEFAGTSLLWNFTECQKCASNRHNCTTLEPVTVLTELRAVNLSISREPNHDATYLHRNVGSPLELSISSVEVN